MTYREIPPSNSALAPYVRFFWTLTANHFLDPQIIVPDGCPEMLFHFGDPYFRLLDGRVSERQPAAFVYGQIERAIVVQPSGVRSDILGARFHPAGLAAFTAMPQQEIREQMVPCVDLWRATPEFRPGSDRIAAVESFLLSRLRPRSEPWRESLSSRQNRRRFQDAVGLSPKRFERIQRLQQAMALLGRSPLADAALAAGYFDQAHFTREFREFTGQTPAQYIRQPHAISDFFVQNVRNVQESPASVGHTMDL